MPPVLAVDARAEDLGEVALRRDRLEELLLRARRDHDLARVLDELRDAVVGVHAHGAQPVELAIGDVGRALLGDALAPREDRRDRRELALVVARLGVAGTRAARLGRARSASSARYFASPGASSRARRSATSTSC